MSKRIPSEGPIQRGSWSERVMVYNTGNGVPPIELLRARLPPFQMQHRRTEASRILCKGWQDSSSFLLPQTRPWCKELKTWEVMEPEDGAELPP